MKTNYIQQEILLMTGTVFLTRRWCEKDPDKKDNLTEKEELEQACWNGMLKDMIPEIYEWPNGDKKLFLWQIKEGKSFIELELGETPEETDKHFSIDPYSFMHLQILS